MNPEELQGQDDPVQQAIKAARAQQVNSDPVQQAVREALLAKRDKAEAAAMQHQKEANPSFGDRINNGVKGLMTGLDVASTGLPGVEILQGVGRSLGSRLTSTPETYGQSVKAGQAERAPFEREHPILSTIGKGAVGGLAASLIPGGAPLQSAIMSGASGLLDPNPDLSLTRRAANTGVDALLGYGAGKASDALTTGARSLVAKSLGKNALERQGAMKATDALNYGKAEAEGAANTGAGQHWPVVSKALAESDIAPYVDIVRGSRSMQGADDATVLREAFKLMSERQGSLGNRILNANDFKAGSSLENRDIGAAKNVLKDAADQIMPSFRGAVEGHAKLAGESGALSTGADAANRILRNANVAGRKLTQNTPEGLLAQLSGMPANEATAAGEGILGKLKGWEPLSPNPLKGYGTDPFGLRSRLTGAAKLTPYLRAADAQAGGTKSSLLRALESLLSAQSGEKIAGGVGGILP